MRSALINILENAIDACTEDKSGKYHKITFGGKQVKNDIVFDVFDNGIGMNNETKEKLFTLFFSSKGARGTGLGLFISNRIIPAAWWCYLGRNSLRQRFSLFHNAAETFIRIFKIPPY